MKKNFQFKKLKFSYDNKPVEKITASKIIFWNNSFSEIRKSDIAEAAPFKISLKNGKIIDVSILKGSETSNKISITHISETDINITFDYLNRKDGGIIQIMHTGDEDSINISGGIIGGTIKASQKHHHIIRKVLHIIGATIYAYFAFLVFIMIIPPNLINEPRRHYLETVPEKYGAINAQNIIFLIIMIILSLIFTLFQEKTTDFIPKNCRGNNEMEKK